MTTTNQLHYASLLEVGEQLRARELSPVELAQATLARIERLNPSLGAYYAVFAETALAEARQAEAEIAKGDWRGPLHGVPIAFKDLYSLGPTTAGSRLLADHVAANEAAAVKRVRAAGAVIVGKLATHEFAMAAATLSDHFPPARNPWDPERTPGGSSTGAGVAVAAGLAFGAYGTDTGGSVRLPASHCGVVGYKPTYGLISLEGVIPLAPTLDHAGPLARTVADAAAMFAAVCGHDPDDPGSSTRQIAIEPKDLTGGIRGLRIGVPRDFWEPTCEPAIRARFEAAVVRLEEMGARVTEASLGLTLLQV
ncbi:MAG: aspartyl-tRNA(Asn)/glutamyl-tRNA(Gln) amidotransferase subunit, partial [Chloroflexota bacterium]|nr:aspartyl-tRNA(Asn)/glutamyl-tRNA(Gln) amidotransferase subunit [Chloroflexota bacterium]